MSKKIAILFVTLSALFWGANFNAGKIAVEHLSPITAAAIRFSLASLIIIPIVLLWESNIKETVKRNLGMYILLGIIGVAGFNGLFFLGLKYTTPVNGALIMATNPIVTMLLAALILNDTIRANQRLGMLFSLIGVIVVITHGSLALLLQLKIALGDWIIMAANICWALYGVLGRRYLKNSKPLITTAATMALGSIALIIFSGYEASITQLTNQSWQVYFSLIYMAVFGSVLAYLFWNYGILHLGVGNTSIFFNLVPVFTVLISIGMGQPILLVQTIGGVLVILGVLVSSNVIELPAKCNFMVSRKG